MNKSQINRYRMFCAVNLVLDNNSASISKIPELAMLKQKLADGVAIIDNERQVQESNITGITETKTELRATILTQALMLSAAIKAYANSTNNLELKSKADYTKTKLVRVSDPILLDICTLLSTTANPIIEELSVYLFNAEKLAQFQNMLDNFRQTIPRQRVATSTKKVSTQNIENEVSSLLALLKEKIDVLMYLFKENEANIYNEYLNARKIIDHAGKSSKTNPESVTES